MPKNIVESKISNLMLWPRIRSCNPSLHRRRCLRIGSRRSPEVIFAEFTARKGKHRNCHPVGTNSSFRLRPLAHLGIGGNRFIFSFRFSTSMYSLHCVREWNREGSFNVSKPDLIEVPLLDMRADLLESLRG